MLHGLGLAMLVQPAAAEPPSLVTLTQGEILLLSDAGEAPAPPAPFALKAGQTLRLSEGASVVVLHRGLARRVIGPGLADPAAFEGKGAEGDEAGLSALLSRQSSLARAGASRAAPADVVLQRPLAEDELVRLPELRWACPAEAGGCPEVEVRVTVMGEAEPLWSGRGAGEARPALAELPEGRFLVHIGDRPFLVQGASAERREELQRYALLGQVAAAELEAPEQAASVVSLLFPLGFESEALWRLDAARAAAPEHAGLAALEAHLEALGGVAVSP